MKIEDDFSLLVLVAAIVFLLDLLQRTKYEKSVFELFLDRFC